MLVWFRYRPVGCLVYGGDVAIVGDIGMISGNIGTSRINCIGHLKGEGGQRELLKYIFNCTSKAIHRFHLLELGVVGQRW